jgi:Mrp family chromosome partitioning ATPase
MTPNPQELLLGELLPQLIYQLIELYDYVIMDTPPIGIISDALILDHFADVTLFVVRPNRTPIDRIKHINELYQTKRLNNLGVVVNGIKDKKWEGYGHGYGYGTNKYYTKYYEQDEKKSKK